MVRYKPMHKSATHKLHTKIPKLPKLDVFVANFTTKLVILPKSASAPNIHRQTRYKLNCNKSSQESNADFDAKQFSGRN